ncbi:hypothetical protein RN001_011354 [Aquatica leii]|uniref:CHK kinase-like domain-containing protein n=1 Tax=Aquatica leii TaxID=1421715 RepID=A0AAN7SNP8_9COLE|nr:hypothetical protein RN001_011354 [Aquatica leii]
MASSERNQASECLNGLLKRLNITLEDSKTTLDVGKGVNYTGEIKKLHIKGKNENGDSVELRLLLKLAPNYLPIRKILTIDRSYQCEMFVYRSLFPLFAEMQTDVEDRFESYPKYFASSANYLNEVIILEDMVQYKLFDRLGTLSHDHALILTKEIGKLHAMSFVLRKRDPKRFREISDNIRNESRDGDEMSKLVSNGLTVWSTRVIQALDPVNDKAAFEKFKNFSNSIDMVLNRHYSFDSNDEYGVISHCDLWAGNLLFDDENHPSQVCIVDWQTARVCSPCIDLAQILFACCDKSLRNKSNIDLIQTYYDSCSSHIRQFGEDPNVLFPYAVLEKHLKKYAGYSLCIAIRTTYMVSIPVDKIPDLSMVQTYMDVIKLFNASILDSNIFDERIRDLMLDYIRYETRKKRNRNDRIFRYIRKNKSNYKSYERNQVSECLNALLKRLNITLEDSKTTLDIGKGVNYNGEIKKLHIKGRNENGDSVELHLLLKLAPNYLPVRTILTIDRSYQCEMFVYRSLFPLFAEMQIDVEDRFESYPKYFASSGNYLNEVIILEDMVQYKLFDRLGTLSHDHALILTKEIGKLHAMSFVLRKRDPMRFREISDNIRNESRDGDATSKLVSNGLSVWSTRIIQALDPLNDKAAIEKFKNFSNSIDMFFKRHYSFDSNDEYGVISHCDVWAGNLLFDDENHPSQVCIVDWQTARVCSPCIDLAQILFACCDKSLRNKSNIDLIQTYYDSCSSHIRQFGEDPNVLFPYAVLEKHLKEYAGYSLCIAFRTIYVMSIPVDKIPDMSMAQTYMDVINLFSAPMLDSSIFDERIRDLMLDYIRYGYDL